MKRLAAMVFFDVRTTTFLNPGPLAQHPKEPSGDDGRCLVLYLAANPHLDPWSGGRLHFVSATNPHPLPSSVVREDEPQLVASARAGDAAAFEELVARYEDKIFRLTNNITGNREDAEDAMQDAFLKAFAHLDGFHGNPAFTPGWCGSPPMNR